LDEAEEPRVAPEEAADPPAVVAPAKAVLMEQANRAQVTVSRIMGAISV
jgi:hypothetical protein